MIKLISVFLILNVTLIANAQSKEDKIKDIRKKYQQIENSITEKKIRKQYFEYRCSESNEHGTVWFIYNKEKLQKIEISSIINEENSQTTRYYFWDDELFFVFYESAVPQTIDANQVMYNYTEKRIYFDKGSPFQCLLKNFSENPNDANRIKSEDIASTQVDCNNIEFIQEHLKVVQKYKDIKDEITLCIW
jgi:hypothetical protein